jgi:hypothetical protein
MKRSTQRPITSDIFPKYDGNVMIDSDDDEDLSPTLPPTRSSRIPANAEKIGINGSYITARPKTGRVRQLPDDDLEEDEDFLDDEEVFMNKKNYDPRLKALKTQLEYNSYVKRNA